MRVGELSRVSGVSVPSIKFYLREGLLPPGARTGRNQADYGDGHVRRLRLVRALIDVGGLSVAATREVLAAVEDPELGLYDALGTAQAALGPTTSPADPDEEAAAAALLDGAVARQGWQISDRNPGRRVAIDVLAAFARLDAPDLAALVDVYADAATAMAPHEVGTVLARAGREQAVEGMVLGVVLGDTLVAALRRMAQADVAMRRTEEGRTEEAGVTPRPAPGAARSS